MTTTTTKRPTHRLIHSVKSGERSFNTRIGAGWQREDGSISLQLDFLPIKTGGFVNLRPIQEGEEEGA